MNRRNVLHQLAATPLGLLGLSAAPARAEGYPERPVRIVVGYPPGSGPDVEARQFAAMLALELGQSVLVENKPGFSGMLALEAGLFSTNTDWPSSRDSMAANWRASTSGPAPGG